MATLTKAELKLWVYTGEINSYTGDPDYTITKNKLALEPNIVFEIAELVKDHLPATFDGSYNSADITSWASYEITSTFSDDTTTVEKNTLLATHGYGYFEDRINPQLTSTLQQSNTCIYWKEGEPVRIPLYMSNQLYQVTFKKNGVVIDDSAQNLGAVSKFITADTTDITADSTLFTADVTLSGLGLNSEYNRTIVAPTGADEITITTADNTQIKLNVYYIEECRNTPYKITFINKFGALQDIWMFGRRKESASITRESFKRSTIGGTASSVFYNTYVPTDRIFNVDEKKSLTMNTGFVCEDYNEVIQQLLAAEHCWIHEDRKVFPIVPKDSVVEYQTHRYEKLLNYTVSFDYGYSEINLVR